MQLSRFADYSLRVLLYVAINSGRRATIQEVAGFYPISPEHLRKVVHELSRCGYLRTYQGKTGGIELDRDPHEIRVGDVIRHFEGHETFVECEGLDCRLAPVCTLKGVLAEGHAALFDTLNQYTLADLALSRPAMALELWNSQS